MEEKEISFEEALNRLEQIVSKLEAGDLSLVESMNMFEEGISLAGQCNHMLDTAEQKIALVRKSETGEVNEEEFSL